MRYLVTTILLASLFLITGCGDDNENVYMQKIKQKEEMEKSLDESFERTQDRLNHMYDGMNGETSKDN